MTSLGRSVLRASVWSGAGSFALRLGQFSVGIVAARLLAPADFGVFAVTLTVYAIVVNISDLGVSAGLIREPGRLGALAPTAVTMSVASTALLALMLWVTAPWTAAAFGTAAASGPIRVMTLLVLLAGPSAVPAALLARGFRQDLKFLVDGVGLVVSTSVLVLMAAGGGGAFALAWSRVAGQVVSVVLLLVLVRERYRPGFTADAARHFLRLGMPIVGASLVGFVIASADVFAIGRLLGSVPLGSYQLATNVSAWPLAIFLPMLTGIGLPLFSRFRGDADALTRVFADVLSAVTAVFWPITALIVALASPLVLLVYGEKWAAVAPILSILALYGAARVPLALWSDVLVAGGCTRRLFLLQVGWLLVLVPVMWVGVAGWGASGAAAAHVLVAWCLVVPVTGACVGRLVRVDAATFRRIALRPLLGAVASGVTAWTVATVARHALGAAPVDDLVAVLAGGLTGLAVYLLTTFGWVLRTVHALRADLRQSDDGPPGEAGPMEKESVAMPMLELEPQP